MKRDVVDRAVERALVRAKTEGVRGAAVTPFLLASVERETGGLSRVANLALLERNASLAAEIAVALSSLSGTGGHGTADARTAAREMRFVSPGR